MSKISYIKLGGTLFLPAIHKSLYLVVCESKYPDLKSVVIDTEDGLSSDELENGLEKIGKLLLKYKKSSLLVFIRPKNIATLKTLLSMEGVNDIDGFILPKFSLANAKEYLTLLKSTDFFIMPSIEGEELFNQNKLYELRDIILTNKEKIVLVRYGLEDMLRQLGMKRYCNESIFDFAASASVLGNFIATFKSVGFGVSGGVYPCFKDAEGFVKDIKRDIKEGLFSKTIIHPSQISVINELYKVTQKEFDEALEICKREDAVFAQDGKMAETKTMSPYAQQILLRAEEYGVL